VVVNIVYCIIENVKKNGFYADIDSIQSHYLSLFTRGYKMRIGEVNGNNYKFFLQMLGVKDSTALDAIMGNGKEAPKTKTPEDFYQEDLRSGKVLDGMFVKEGDTSWHKIVPVSDDVRNKIIETVRNEFLESGNGIIKADKSKMPSVNKAYLKSLPANERLSAVWTLSQIQTEEERRIAAYVRKMDPTWDYGKKFDPNILIKSNFGTNSVDVKA